MTAAQAIFANPGQTVRLVVQTVDVDGYRADGYVPEVVSVYFPDLSLAKGYPTPMVRINTGLYIHGLVIPGSASAIGTFIVNIFYMEAGRAQWEVFTIQVARPFGNSSVAPM